MARDKNVTSGSVVKYRDGIHTVTKARATEVHLDGGTIVDLKKENVYLIDESEAEGG